LDFFYKKDQDVKQITCIHDNWFTKKDLIFDIAFVVEGVFVFDISISISYMPFSLSNHFLRITKQTIYVKNPKCNVLDFLFKTKNVFLNIIKKEIFMFSTHIHNILYEMCQRVGADYDTIDFQEAGWYTKYTWSVDEENSYKAWLFEYLRNNKDARREIMRFPSTKQKNIERCVNSFIFNYGFVTRNDNINGTP
jgi:hypothetical protein